MWIPNFPTNNLWDELSQFVSVFLIFANFPYLASTFLIWPKKRLGTRFPGSHFFPTMALWCFRPCKPYIFWKLLVQRYQNWYYQVSHAQIHKYKYTNTQIQHMTKCQKDPTCGIFLKRGLFKDIKNYIPMCQMRKSKIKCQKDPIYVWYMFEKAIVQGYLLSLAQLYKV